MIKNVSSKIEEKLLDLDINSNKNMVDKFSYLYSGQLHHLHFNKLIAFPGKALSQSNPNNKVNDQKYLTSKEFESILKSLYNKNFILVNLSDIQFKTNHIDIKLPINKIPIIISFDNIFYSKNNDGFIDKIIVDRNNLIATYSSKKSISQRVSYDNEFICILENFIKHHPDFTLNNAKIIIGFNGINGQLGYNTQSNNATNSYEAKKVSKVLSKLKELGYQFACNGYYLSSNFLDMEIVKDFNKWNTEINDLIPNCNIYAPCDKIKKDIIENEKIIQLLKVNSFSTVFFESAIPENFFYNNILFISRFEVNGYTLRNNAKALSPYFDAFKIFDHANRKLPYESKLTKA